VRRLLAVTPTGFIGGAEHALVRLASWARDAGWGVVIAGPPGPMSELARRESGATWIDVPELKLPRGPRPLGVPIAAARSLAAARRIRRHARDTDVVVANGLLALPAIRLTRPPRPVVLLVRDLVGRRDWRLLLRVFGSTATLSVAPSRAAAAPLRSRGLPVEVVYHGTAWPVEPAVPNPAAPVVGMAAYLTHLKGQHLLLEAVARLGRRDLVVELAGGTYHKDEHYESQLRARAARPDLAGQVRFLGEVPDAVERMRSWRVVAAPSLQPETGGLAVLEAMSIGVPVVAADHGGPAETLGDAGVLVEPGDIGALARALARLLDDDALRDKCAFAGRERIEASFTLERERRELLGVLASVGAR
jgi:glycosyltransferase involved in cell wall biosynthesis